MAIDTATPAVAAPAAPAAGMPAAGTPVADATKTQGATKAPGPASSVLGGAVTAEGAKGAAAPEGDKGTPAPSGEPKGSGAPGAAELDVKLPEGIEVDAKVMGDFKALAKESGLTSESASKMAALYVAQQQADYKAQVDAWQRQSEEWGKSLEADPDFGGKNYQESVVLARKAAVRFGGQPLVDALVKYGMDNLPELSKAFARIGRAIAEDDSSVVQDGGKAVADPKALLRTQYPSMFNADGTQKG